MAIIVGVLAAVAIPRFTRGDYDDARLYQETLTALRYAQRTALAQQRTVCVTFTGNTQLTLKYDPTYGGANCGSGSGQNLPAPGATDGALTYTVVRTGSAAYSGQADFNFDRIGKPSASVTLTIGGRQMKVEAETGYVYEP